MIVLKAILAGLYVGLDHGIWIGMLLRTIRNAELRTRILVPISIWVTVIQTILCFFIEYFQENFYLKLGTSIVLILTCLQLFQEMPQKRSDGFREIVRIVFLILSGSMDNLITIQVSTSHRSDLMVFAALLSYPLIVFTVRYLVPIVERKLWFFIYGILLMSFTAGQVLWDAFEIDNTLIKTVSLSAILVFVFFFGPIFASIRSRNNSKF